MCTKFQDHTTSSFLVVQICIFIFWKAMLQIASQNFPELNALNFFSVTVKDTGLPDSQREINLVIFHLNYILIHLNILPYSVLNWEYLKLSALGTALMTVLIKKNSKATIFPSFIGNEMYFHINFYLCNNMSLYMKKHFTPTLKTIAFNIQLQLF